MYPLSVRFLPSDKEEKTDNDVDKINYEDCPLAKHLGSLETFIKCAFFINKRKFQSNYISFVNNYQFTYYNSKSSKNKSSSFHNSSGWLFNLLILLIMAFLKYPNLFSIGLSSSSLKPLLTTLGIM